MSFLYNWLFGSQPEIAPTSSANPDPPGQTRSDSQSPILSLSEDDSKLIEARLLAALFRPQPFDMAWIGEGQIMSVFGGLASGKTTLAIDFLKHHPNLTDGLVFSHAEMCARNFAKHLPAQSLHYAYDPKLIEPFKQAHGRVFYGNSGPMLPCVYMHNYAMIYEPTFLIFDSDGIPEANNSLNDLFKRSRVHRTNIMITQRYPLPLEAEIRDRVDWVFIFAGLDEASLRWIYNGYGHQFPSFEMFEALVRYYTKDYGCLVIGRGRALDSSIYWYKVDISQH